MNKLLNDMTAIEWCIIAAILAILLAIILSLCLGDPFEISRKRTFETIQKYSIMENISMKKMTLEEFEDLQSAGYYIEDGKLKKVQAIKK